MRNGARVTSGRIGTSPRCAARVSTPATEFGWRSTSRDAVRELVGLSCGGMDRNAPEFGDLAVGDGFQKHSYPFGIMLNAKGIASSTRRRLSQLHLCEIRARDPRAAGAIRWQIFDDKVKHLLRDEYRIKQVTKVVADRSKS